VTPPTGGPTTGPPTCYVAPWTQPDATGATLPLPLGFRYHHIVHGLPADAAPTRLAHLAAVAQAQRSLLIIVAGKRPERSAWAEFRWGAFGLFSTCRFPSLTTPSPSRELLSSRATAAPHPPSRTAASRSATCDVAERSTSTAVLVPLARAAALAGGWTPTVRTAHGPMPRIPPARSPDALDARPCDAGDDGGGVEVEVERRRGRFEEKRRKGWSGFPESNHAPGRLARFPPPTYTVRRDGIFGSVATPYTLFAFFLVRSVTSVTSVIARAPL